jgi:undecaprenyl diphosphate synthase
MIKPKHIAIVMDGNGRWAEARGLDRSEGHKAGFIAVQEIVKACVQRDIRYLTVFAFSSENWNRPKSEVSALMKLFTKALSEDVKNLRENGVHLQMVGDISKFSKTIQKLGDRAQKTPPEEIRLTLSLAVNYGGRWDVTQAAKQIAEKVKSGELSPKDVDENLMNSLLATAPLPDPDLVIRTSGEQRISNFLLWQSAYSEYYFTSVLWPDFTPLELDKSLADYAQRDRRYGKTAQQIKVVGE